MLLYNEYEKDRGQINIQVGYVNHILTTCADRQKSLAQHVRNRLHNC